MRRLNACALTALFAASLALSTCAQEKEAKGPATERDVAKPETAEDALRTFILAMFEKDEDTLTSVALPTDPEELRWLLAGEELPEAARELMRKSIANVKFKSLKVGDKIRLPSRTYVLTKEDVGLDRVALQMPGDPLFHRVRLVEGVWLVDPRPLIAARKAAEASRQRKKAEAEPTVKEAE